MRCIFFLALLLPFVSQAAPDPEAVKATLEAQPTCANMVRFDEQYMYLGFGAYRNSFEEPRHPIPARISVVPMGHPDQGFSLATSDAAIDAIRAGDSLFVLTYSSIEEWSLSSLSRVASYSTYSYGGSMAYMEHAQAFARAGDKLIIAHGRLGVSIFDLRTKRLRNQFRLIPRQLPLESMATGVTITGNAAYVLMDNFSLVSQGKPAFRGLVKIDIDSERVIAELDGLDPGADAIVSDGNRAIVSFGGNPIWKYSLANLRGPNLPEPDLRIWRFPRQGHPVGTPSMDGKYYYSCFSAAPEGQGGHFKNIPMVLNRAQMLLD